MNGPAQIQLLGCPLGVTSGNYADAYILTPEQESQLLSGLWYLNILLSGLLILAWTFFMIRRRS